MTVRSILTATALLLLPILLPAQRLDWRTRATFYADNTEFFTPYRVGETILGAELRSWLDAEVGKRTNLQFGLSADRRFGTDEFADSLKPVIALRYQHGGSVGIIGTLDPGRDRHGLLEPAMVATREITTPIEYGAQWRERRGRLDGDVWLNWRKLNTPAQREEFEIGGRLEVYVAEGLALAGQHLWSHRGGQLHDAGVPVTNNRVSALGLKLRREILGDRKLVLEGWRLWSTELLDPDAPAGRPDRGSGTLVKGELEIIPTVHLMALGWWGSDFVAAAGDNNYNSTGHDGVHYEGDRRYLSFGVVRRAAASRGVTVDGELRWHRVDDEESIAFFGTPWELSYRAVFRVPFGVSLNR